MNLSVEGVSFAYPNGAQALQDVSLQIPAGQQVAWIGANGAGKSTLARLANGLLRPLLGRVQVGDWDTREHRVSELAHRVGHVFQNPDEQLFARTLREEVAFGPRNLGRSPAVVNAAVMEALAALDLSDLAEVNPYDLPPARRKDLGLAAILAMQPPIVILDEPTTGQDAEGLERLGRVLRQARTRSQTMITITHDMEFCSEYADRLAVFSEGKILIEGPVGEVFRRRDLLDLAQVEPPQLIRLADRLHLPDLPLGVDSFLESWQAARGGEGRP
ncbi:MAG: ABC transporter ATP-binding protein [Anaerolineales bacterium]